VMAGQAVILLIPYLNRVIKRISGRTGASLWFRRYTCASASDYYYETITQAAVATDDSEGTGPRGTPTYNRTLSRGATRSAIQQL